MHRDWRLAVAGAIAGLLLGLAVAATVRRDGSARSGPAPAPSPSYRLGEVAWRGPAVRLGRLVLRPSSAKCGMGSLIGTHAEFQAQGEYCRLRLTLVAEDAAYVSYDSRVLTLRTSAGVAPIAREAMNVARQPLEVQLGAHDVLALDVWFDYPIGARPLRLEVRGGSPAGVDLPARRWPDPVKL